MNSVIDILFMAKDKPSARESFRYLLGHSFNVKGVVTPAGGELAKMAEQRNIPVFASAEEFPAQSTHIDLVVSFLYWKRIKEPLISASTIGCINFHPAPLPDYKGLGGYNFAICESALEWGVSAHFVDQNLDTGDLIKVDRFPIDHEKETAYSLEQKSQDALLALFRELMNAVRLGQKLPRRSQEKSGRYITKSMFEELREVQPSDSPEAVERKIRAFWFPPFPGAFVRVGGQEFTLVDNARLAEIAGLLRKKND